MRTPRIKIAPHVSSAIYHCISRTVNGERCLDDTAKEVLRKQLWQIAEFCGLQILTYAIMANHFHVLVRVPQKTTPDDGELLRRFHVLYPKPNAFQTFRIDTIAAQLKNADPAADPWRKQQLALMGDVSQFMKLLKQRFSIWFNRTHHRFGTLWSERFKSVLVEGRGNVTATMAAYIDLNPVRAGLVADPKDYRFCGYAEAVAGNKSAQAGIAAIIATASGNVSETTHPAWRDAREPYRLILFGAGTATRANKAAIAPETLEKVVAENGTLPLATVLRCRLRHFTDGAVLGTKAYVAAQLATYRRITGHRARTRPRPLPNITDWGAGNLSTLRGLRKNAFA
jgi:REP element-mobilizing transposase RayT